MKLELEHVSVAHGDGSEALSDLNLVIPRGQICALVGASGSGKTSLLRLLGGHLAPSAGVLRADGLVLDLRGRKRIAARIGQIYQDHRLVLQSSAAQNIAHGAAPTLSVWRTLLGLYPGDLRERCLALALELGLDLETVGREVSALSGGQQQRVGIARALIMQRDVILADEPISSLDPVTGAQVLALLRQRAKAMRATLICSLHQPELIGAFADRVVMLAGGRIVSDGPPAATAFFAAA